MWVPGHNGVEGNEKADEMARKGAETPFEGPEPFCGITQARVQVEVDSWEQERVSEAWRKRQGLRHSKIFIKRTKQRAE